MYVRAGVCVCVFVCMCVCNVQRASYKCKQIDANTQ